MEVDTAPREDPARPAELEEFKLPPIPSLIIVLFANVLLQVCCFVDARD